jgi:hypothetical protein
MSKSLTTRVSRVAVGMAVLGAFAVVPFAAQAAVTNGVWVVRAAGAGVLITLSVAVWKLAPRAARAVA